MQRKTQWERLWLHAGTAAQQAGLDGQVLLDGHDVWGCFWLGPGGPIRTAGASITWGMITCDVIVTAAGDRGG